MFPDKNQKLFLFKLYPTVVSSTPPSPPSSPSSSSPSPPLPSLPTAKAMSSSKSPASSVAPTPKPGYYTKIKVAR